ncbi:ATP-binding domain-containing protein [Actinacidiphila sp. ITFR-21]|uniref:ATP-binding domain-containing protein n=1 Tax=Actinacidiphila sp. ITFR-21 TaxID=3075199 RepID=UPI0037DA3BA8
MAAEIAAVQAAELAQAAGTPAPAPAAGSTQGTAQAPETGAEADPHADPRTETDAATAAGGAVAPPAAVAEGPVPDAVSVPGGPAPRAASAAGPPATAAGPGDGGLAADPQPHGTGAGSRRRGPASPAAPRPVAVDPAAVAAARQVLLAGGAPGGLAEEAVRILGERAGAELRADPWEVLGLAGVRVEHADAFARALLGAGSGPGDARRARALVGFLMERAAEQGHTALTADALKAALVRHTVPDPDAAVAEAVEDGRVLAFGAGAGTEEADPDEEEEETADRPAAVPLLLGLDRYALAEESLADGLIRLLRSFDGVDGPMWEKAAADAPSASAAELVRAAAGSGLVLHTGGEAARAEPAALVTAAREAGLRAYAAAYTENGRRRLAEAVGEDAALTVAGLLDGGAGPGRDGDGTLALDLLAVLDAPQLSVEEAADLVEAVPDGARLVLSGDPHALWSAGPGRAFADLLAARVCPRVTSRTPDPGPIGALTSYVSVGEFATVEAPGREVVLVPVRDPQEALLRTVQLVADSVPRVIGVPADRTQVIALAHGGAVGTRALNAALKERLNPGPGRFGGFDPGDRVVYVPAPGRTVPGTVVGAEPDGLRLECEGGGVLVPRDDVAGPGGPAGPGGKVRHGWAVTAHQAAGTRWPAVVVVVPGDAGPLLTRSWVYTAFTRGERHLSVVRGGDQALAQAVAGPAAKERTTRLTGVLRELAAEG